MQDFSQIQAPQLMEALIGFSDLTNFSTAARKLGGTLELFGLMQDFADINAAAIAGSGGLIIKYMGDSAIIIFPGELVDRGIRTCIRLRQELHAYFQKREFQTRVSFAFHYGEIAIGRLRPFPQLDITGEAVNVAAMLNRFQYKGQFVMTPQVFRKLTPETRKLVHKFTPPVVYLLED